MPSFDVLSDTVFRDQAAGAVDGFVQDYGCPVKRSQISGLRQIAVHQPGRIKEFANHQQSRAERRCQNASKSGQEKIQKEIGFWKLIADLCEGRPPRCNWSLQQQAEALVPAELQVEDLPPGTKLAKNEQAERAEIKKRMREWLEQWKVEHYHAFFHRFCAQYLYCLGKRGE